MNNIKNHSASRRAFPGAGFMIRPFTRLMIIAALSSPASVLALSTNLFTEDLSAFDVVQNVGDGTTFGVEVIAPPTPFNDGNALRMFDFSAGGKPELQGELDETLFSGFRIDFQSLDQSVITNTTAIRFRIANSGKAITSGDRSALSLSWQANGMLTASFDTGTGTVSSINSAALLGVNDVTLIANGTTNLTYSYDLFSLPRTIDPLSYDVYVNGVLLNDSGSFTNIPSTGLPFSVVPEYTPGLGIKRFGLVGSSNPETDPDVWFDNILLESFEIPASPQPISFVGTVVTNGFSYLSQTGETYALQSSTNATSEFADWKAAGMEAAGDGTVQVLFDPKGIDPAKDYRVVKAP